MQEKPILFSSAMVQAILEGRKTQTRRVIKPQPDNFFIPEGIVRDDGKPYYRFSWNDELPRGMKNEYGLGIGDNFGLFEVADNSPYGKYGDRLWVREAFWIEHDVDYSDYQGDPIDCGISLKDDDWAKVAYCATDKEPPDWVYHSKHPSIHMPRWASRINLEITDIRVEQLQQIANHRTDCLAEGIIPTFRDGGLLDFIKLWDSINAKRGYAWETNPWVWVIKFKLLETN